MRGGKGAGIGPGRKTTGVREPERALPERSRHERELLLRYRRDGDRQARDELVGKLLPLARRIARRYRGGPEPFEDLVQVASVGVMKAIHGFEPDRGVTLRHYAEQVIEGEIRHHFRDCAELVHVPRALRSRALRVARVTRELSERLGRPPRLEEVAAGGHLTLDEVLEALDAGLARRVMSLEGTPPARGEERPGYLDGLGAEDGRLRQVEDQAALRSALSTIPARDRLMLFRRVVDGLSYGELGRAAGLSATHVSRVLGAATARVRRALGGDYPRG